MCDKKISIFDGWKAVGEGRARNVFSSVESQPIKKELFVHFPLHIGELLVH